MSKITKLTPDQISRFDEWVQKYVAIGLSTEPADFDAAEKAARQIYELCALKQPLVVLRMDSPYGAVLGGALAVGFLNVIRSTHSQVESQVWNQVESQVRSQVENQVESQVRSQVENQVENQVMSQVRNQVWKQVMSQVGNQVRKQVWKQVESQVEKQVGNQVISQVENQVGSQVEKQVWNQVWNQVISQVENQVMSQVRNQVWKQVESKLGDAVYNYRGGSFWVSWIAYISFLRDVVGWGGSSLANFSFDEVLAINCGLVWWHEDVLAISDRPRELHRDDKGSLHNDDGPALAYRDGWALWRRHGEEWPEDSLALQAMKVSLGYGI